MTEPDLALLKPDPTFYAEVHPTAQDAFLVIEVSRSSLQYDRSEKLPRYADTGIAEVWIIDLGAGFLEVYKEPFGRSYRQRTLVYRGESVNLSAFPDAPSVVPLP